MDSFTGVLWIDVCVAIGVLAAAVTAIVGGARWLGKVLRPIHEFLEDWRGEEARPGVPERPGVMARLQSMDQRLSYVEEQLSPNSGKSTRDAIDRIESTLGTQQEDQ